jgi:hypothetical protein
VTSNVFLLFGISGEHLKIQPNFVLLAELVGWLRSEGRVASMISKVMKIMESIEEKLRTESYNGYTGSVWEADDPISGVINEKSQELLFRLRKLTELLDVPTEEVADDMAEGFYLLFSAMHVLLSHPYVPITSVYERHLVRIFSFQGHARFLQSADQSRDVVGGGHRHEKRRSSVSFPDTFKHRICFLRLFM